MQFGRGRPFIQRTRRAGKPMAVFSIRALGMGNEVDRIREFERVQLEAVGPPSCLPKDEETRGGVGKSRRDAQVRFETDAWDFGLEAGLLEGLGAEPNEAKV